MKAGFPFHKQYILQDDCSDQNFEIIISTKIKENVYFCGKITLLKFFSKKI